MIAVRNSDYYCKYRDQSNRRHKDHNLVSQTESNTCQDADNGQLNCHCTPTLTFQNWDSTNIWGADPQEAIAERWCQGRVRRGLIIVAFEPDISVRRMDERRRPPFECQPAGVRDAVAPDLDRLSASVDGLNPRRCESGADEARDCVTIDSMGDYKQFFGGAVRTAGKQL